MLRLPTVVLTLMLCFGAAAHPLHDHAPEPTSHEMLRQAWQAQAEHRFDEAQALLDSLLREHPTAGAAWSLKAAVHLVGGQIEAAKAACTRAAAHLPKVAAMGCFARASLASGDEFRERYAAVMETLLSQSTLTPALAAWGYLVAGELRAATGSLERAEQHFRASMATAPSNAARVALADLLIDDRRWRAARQITSGQQDLALAVRHARIQRQLGRHTEPLAPELAELIASEDNTHGRELAYYFIFVDLKPALAQKLARENLLRQNEAIDRMLLSEASARL